MKKKAPTRKSATRKPRGQKPRAQTVKSATKSPAKSTAKTTGKVATTAKSGTRKVAERTVSGAGPKAIDRLIETGGVVTKDLKYIRFAGVALGGGKTDKTAVAVLEFYPDQRRVFLRSLREKISGRGDITADEALLQVLNEEEKELSAIAFDAPLQLPKCVRCDHRCPGEIRCHDPVTEWMRDMHRKRDKLKRPNKMFTPYTERACEIYIANELEEPFHPPQALGSNAAPLAARALFLSRRIQLENLIEVYPKLTLWRIGNALDIPKSHLRFHKHAVDSDEARLYILRTLIAREIAFIYQQDLRLMVENSVGFDAFICALTAFLKFRGQTEARPLGFPREEIWIDFPKQKIQWF